MANCKLELVAKRFEEVELVIVASLEFTKVNVEFSAKKLLVVELVMVELSEKKLEVTNICEIKFSTNELVEVELVVVAFSEIKFMVSKN